MRAIKPFVVLVLKGRREGIASWFIWPFLLWLAFTGWWACANPVPPSGGLKDNVPPRLDSARTSPNYQVNFSTDEIVLTFDEWVRLDDILNQVVVSPPLEHSPEIRLKGRSVHFTFHPEEKLRPNATYTINFGNAIKDLTEGNTAEDLKFIFSTGPFLDSLEVRGRLVRARTNEPVAKAYLMLYEDLADSVVRTQKPFYFARSDENGTFRISNVRADTFKAFALVDANLNYLFDQPRELIGFPDSPIVVSGQEDPFLSLLMFEERPDLRIMESRQPYEGKLSLLFNQSPELVELSYAEDSLDLYREAEGDSLVIWYRPGFAGSGRLIFRSDTVFQDTLFLKGGLPRDTTLDLLPQAGKARRKTNSSIEGVVELPGVNLSPQKSLLLVFSHPLSSVDPTLVRLEQDTLGPVNGWRLDRDSQDLRRLLFTHKWAEGSSYQLEFLPGSVTDWFGNTLDTTRQPIRVLDQKDFGTLSLRVTDIPKDSSLIIRILKGEQEVETFIPDGAGTFETRLVGLNPGEYQLELILDRNANGRWDPGVYAQHIQPERVFIKKLEQLRANWELEASISANVFNESER